MQVPTIKVTFEVKSFLTRDFGHEGLGRLVTEETVPKGSSGMALLHTLAGRYPLFRKKAFTVKHKVTFDYCAVILNGTTLCSLAELDTELKDGDTLKLIPHIYGG